MREIKFRVWDAQAKKWVEPEWVDIRCSGVIVRHWVHRGVEIRLEKPAEDLKVMQYTGLKDKNGKEIYEGDIVTYEYEKGFFVVRFGEGYQGEPADGMYPYWGWYTDGRYDRYAFGEGDLEVVGNIHENPAMAHSKTSR